VVRLLLEHEADVDAKDTDGGTALYQAAWNGHEAVVRLLLEHEADVDAKDTDGGAALRRAAEYGYEVGTCSTDSLSCSSCCSVVLPFFVLVYSASAQRVLVAVGAGEWQSLENGSRRRMVVAATVSVAV
jgi:hypothetical protein